MQTAFSEVTEIYFPVEIAIENSYVFTNSIFSYDLVLDSNNTPTGNEESKSFT